MHREVLNSRELVCGRPLLPTVCGRARESEFRRSGYKSRLDVVVVVRKPISRIIYQCLVKEKEKESTEAEKGT